MARWRLGLRVPYRRLRSRNHRTPANYPRHFQRRKVHLELVPTSREIRVRSDHRVAGRSDRKLLVRREYSDQPCGGAKCGRHHDSLLLTGLCFEPATSSERSTLLDADDRHRHLTSGRNCFSE